MEQTLLAGLSIAVAGLITTFLALGLFGFIIWALGKLFVEKEQVVTEVTSEPSLEPEIAAVVPAESNDIPVVIATAISYFISQTQNSLGSSLDEGRSGWWSSNRMRATQGTGIRIKRSGQ